MRGLRLSAVLAELDDSGEPLTLGEILDRTAHAGFGFLACFLALVSIPFFGLSAPFGLAIAVLGAELVIGRTIPWLPGFLRRRKIPPRALRWLANKLASMTSRIERFVRPRLPRMASGRVVGLALVVQGIGLALPIPIPGSNWVFIAPIIVYALGLLEGDGVLVALGHVGLLVQIALGIAFAEVVQAAITRILA